MPISGLASTSRSTSSACHTVSLLNLLAIAISTSVSISLSLSLSSSSHCLSTSLFPFLRFFFISLAPPPSLAKDEWETVGAIVKTLHEQLSVPVTCKIRVFEDRVRSVDYAKMLQSNGCQVCRCLLGKSFILSHRRELLIRTHVG